MVAKKNKIWQPGDTPMIDELAEELRKETTMMCKRAALEWGCDVEDIAVSVCNDGMVQLHLMTSEEKAALLSQEAEDKRIRLIKKDRGVFSG